jgi:23S rRNA (guanosine2251-2'-O)-methyltransferase
MHKLTVLEMNRLTTEEFRQADKTPLVVVLDNVRSMHNVGSVLRTADGFRVQKVCLCGITGRPPHPEIHKTALGAEDSVEWEYFTSTAECVSQLKSAGFVVVSAEQVEGSVSMLEWNERRPTAVVLGNEVKGVAQEVVDQSDYCLEIPQFGTKHSFNVSCAAAMIMWQYFCNWRKG